MKRIKIKVINKSGFDLPEYATPQSAGMDLRSAVNLTINPGERKLVGTGLKIALPEGYEAQIRPRSGLALKYGITVLNTPGTIDADYRGEIGVLLINLGDSKFNITAGDKIAQMVIASHVQADFECECELDETDRGDGGWGHSGVK